MFGSHGPQVETSVDLDQDSKRPLFAGSSINGSVRIHTISPRQLQSAEIIMFGRAITHYARMHAVTGEFVSLDYADDSRLFRINELLAQGQYMYPDMPLSLPFNLRLPQRIEAPTTANPYAQETRYQGSYVYTTHPLPPSFSMIAGAKHFALIEYNIQAMLQFEGEKGPLTVQLPEPLLVLLSNDGPPIQRQPVEFIKVPEKYSTSRLLGNAKSKRASLSDRFSSSAPSVNVVMRASVPGAFFIGRPFPISVAAEVDSPSTPKISIPSILFRVVDLQLWKVTYSRSLRPNAEEEYGGHRAVEAKASEPDTMNALPESALVQQQFDGNGSGKVWLYAATFEARLPGSACPSFNTFNISLSYRIKLTAESEICGKTFRYEVDVPDVVVLPPA